MLLTLLCYLPYLEAVELGCEPILRGQPRYQLVHYSGPPLSVGDAFQNPQWIPETRDCTKPRVCFFLYIYACDKV